MPPPPDAKLILYMLAGVIATICVLALLAGLNCFFWQRTCGASLMHDTVAQVIAALLGLYAGSRRP